jgi:hypothetical protein
MVIINIIFKKRRKEMNQTIQNNEVKETKEISLKSKIYDFLKKNHVKIICFMVFALVIYAHYMGYSVFAETGSEGADAAKSGGGSEDALWKTITDLMKTWVTRLGGVVMFVGGIMFGLGWKSDDAEQKSRGVSTIIGGAIVIAIAQIAAKFFK